MVNKPSIFDWKKVIEFEMWILTDFQLENWVKIHISNSITFCLVKAKGFLTTRFFCHSKLYVMSNFGGDRMSRKKMRNKKLLLPTYEYQKYFVSHSFSVCPITTKLWYMLQIGITKKRVFNKPSIFDREKLLSLKGEFWPIFRLKIGSKFTFQTQ